MSLISMGLIFLFRAGFYAICDKVCAKFNTDGTLLIAVDNERLYLFDVVTHLILEDYELGLLEGEAVRLVRQSRD